MSTIASREIVDPMPTGKLGMWFFLASEAMFFVGLLGSFVVLESAGGQHQLFVQSSQLLSRWIGLGGVACLVISSLAIWWGKQYSNWITAVAGALFIVLQGIQWRMLLHLNSGPSRNNFFGWYFLTSAVHGSHVVAGLITLLWFALRPKAVFDAKTAYFVRGSLPPSLQIYWHFVNAVGVISLAVLYFV